MLESNPVSHSFRVKDSDHQTQQSEKVGAWLLFLVLLAAKDSHIVSPDHLADVASVMPEQLLIFHTTCLSCLDVWAQSNVPA